MPKALTADRSTPAMGTPVSTAIQSAAQMNSLLSPGVSTSPIMTAAEGGDSLAQFELGRRLTLGEGVSVDMKKAAEWFEKAADQSMPQAQYSLANLYEKGHGVKKDLMVARLWYERAAKAGNVKAMHNLAVIHVEGGLGKPDFKQASDWFIKAADHGLKDSQYNLAILFARGMGVKQDLVQSYKWFAIAAHNGDRGAAAKRDEVARVLTGAQLKTAKAIVEAWIPKMSKPSANQVASIPDAWRVTAGAVPGQAGVKLVDPGKPSPEIVRQAQGMLSALGFNTGQPDGKIGPRTRTAIRNFQKSAGFPIDGKLTPALMQALAIRLG
jgi:localization factor PodJL